MFAYYTYTGDGGNWGGHAEVVTISKRSYSRVVVLNTAKAASQVRWKQWRVVEWEEVTK